MSDRYREVAPATDIVAEPPLSPFSDPRQPGAVLVQADKGWAFLSILSSGKEAGVFMSRDEITRLYDLLGEAERHLWQEEREAGDE